MPRKENWNRGADKELARREKLRTFTGKGYEESRTC